MSSTQAIHSPLVGRPWSLPALKFSSSRGLAPPVLASWVQSTYGTHRIGVHFISIMMTLVPTSETRLLNEGLVPLYQGFTAVEEALRKIAEEQNIPLNQCSPIHPDYRIESQIDSKILESVLTGQPAQAMADLMEKAVNGTRDGRYHWSSLVACLCVPSESVITQTAIANSNGTTQPHSLFTNALASESQQYACKVTMEELARLKNGAPETGWREDEAASLVEEHFRIAEELSSSGKLCEE